MSDGMTVGRMEDLAQIIADAVKLVKPTITHLLRSDLTAGRRSLHIVVGFQGSVLYQESFGRPESEWEYPFDKIARAKTRMCMRTSMVGRTLLRDAPWLIMDDDTRYPGGVVENGLVVAASGIQDHFDEMISWMVLKTIQGLCRDEMSKIQDDDPDFF